MKMGTIRPLLVVSCASAILSGCSSNSAQISPGGATPLVQSGSEFQYRESVSASHAMRAKAGLAGGYSVIYNFKGGSSDGSGPNSTLVFDSSGALYGTTCGTPGECGDGTVFKLTPSNGGAYTETVLYSFAGFTDGYDPQGAVVDAQGSVYGITNAGGPPGQGICGGGCGTVWKLVPQSGGSYSKQVLHSFQGGTDGATPYGSLAIDASGALYGTTYAGGTGSCTGDGVVIGCGTVFKLMPSGSGYNYNVIYSFQDNGDGIFPEAGLLLSSGGVLLGTTTSGGQYDGGTAFALSPSGSTYTERLIHSFNGQTGEHIFPTSALVSDSDGNLYGSTSISYPGGVYKLTRSGSTYTESNLYSYKAKQRDKYELAIGLTVGLDAHGDVFGATNVGGTSSAGYVYKLVAKPKTYRAEILEDFDNSATGGDPQGGVILDSSGAAYGTANTGGSTGNGLVYKITP